MGKYAKTTNVSIDRTRAEIEITLKRYGAEKFGYMIDNDSATIGFRANGKNIRFVLTMPEKKDFEYSPGGRWRNQSGIEKAFDQACRQRWRALLLVIKAKLEAVESNITTFETEFMPYIVTPTGRTIAEEILPQIENMYLEGKVPSLLMLGKPNQ